MKRTCLLVALVVLYAALALTGTHAWLLRAVAITVFATVLAFILLLYGVNPRLKIITGGKLLYQGGTTLRRHEVFFKICSVLVSLVIMISCAIPLIRGSFMLVRDRQPFKISGTVVDVSSFMGLWFLGEGIYLQGEKRGYQYLFSVEPRPRRGDIYTLHVLPGTRFVLLLQRDGTQR